MKFKLTLILLIISVQASTKTISVLFLGNSYTGVNNLPKMVGDLAASGGDTVIYQSNTPGGYTLYDHYFNSTSIDLIKSKNWDYVVLQEQSQLPTIDYYKEPLFYKYADSLNKVIKDNYGCTKIVLYMTWGRKFGGKQCAGGECSPNFVDFNHMQDSLEAAYLENASLIKALVSPVGISWKNSIAQNNSINLFDTDNSHPSAWGSYLAACTFYATLFQKSPEGLSYTAFLPNADAEFLQKVAAETVLKSSLSWNINKYGNPTAEFVYLNPIGRDFLFASTTDNVANYYWNLGDGSGYKSGGDELEHTFSKDGVYEVCLVVQDSCGNTDTTCQNITVTPVGIGAVNQYSITVYPNPTTGILHFKNPTSGEIRVVNSVGLTVYQGILTSSSSIDLSLLPKGIYYININTGNSILSQKVLLI